MTWMIGIDTGGTFTDVIGMNRDSGEVRTVKVPSTPRDPSQAIINGVRALIDVKKDFAPADISFLAHGTTVATNAVIERKGASTGMLITKGTNAVYFARMSRQPEGTEALNPDFQKPAPLIPLALTREINERLAFDGSVVTPLDEEEVLAKVRELVAQKQVTSLAVCYLFSFMRDTHEQATLQAIRREFPDIRVSLSSAILPIIREYRRLSTTVLDAFVGPTLDGYLRRLGRGLKDAGVATPQVFIMQSNGGLMSIDVASSNPVQTLLSGPAGGVISGKYLSRITEFNNLVTFDVGGTSTDVAAIVDGENSEISEGSVAGHDSSVPMSEIGTIAAGGGTIARVGADGRLRVGPDSAGADPGPVCFGIGGQEPTVADAALVLGYLDPDTPLGGRVKIRREPALQAIEMQIARPLGLSVEDAALGIMKIINSTMEGEIRLRLMARGYNPRDFALVAMGGGGPMHASMVAANLGFKAVLVPPYPGLASAMGLLLTDIRHTYLQSRPGHFGNYDGRALKSLFDVLRAKGMTESLNEGTAADAVQFLNFLELRYVGQGYELAVPCPDTLLTEADRLRISAEFHRMHEKIYGHCAPDAPIEVVNCRVDSVAPMPKLHLSEKPPSSRPLSAVPVKGRRQVYTEGGGFVDTPVYLRAQLEPGDRIPGPAIIEQADTTTVVLDNQLIEMEARGNIILRFVRP
ncbi:MAG: hydantoinase/oxoprolinase family protein [Pseudomonadota bacterium]